MRKPEEIVKEIENLRLELERSKEYYQYELLKPSPFDDKRIGPFRLGLAEIVLSQLYNGKKLRYRHNTLGSVDVRMNVQKNRILANNNIHFDEESIMTYIVWNIGEWYVNNENNG